MRRNQGAPFVGRGMVVVGLLAAALAAGCGDDPGRSNGGGGGAAGSGGSGGSGGTGGQGGEAGTGGTGGGEAREGTIRGVTVGARELLDGDGVSVEEGVLVHGQLENAGPDRNPSIQIRVDGNLETAHVILGSADGSLPVVDGEFAVENGTITVPVDASLFIDIPYRLVISPVDGALKWNDTVVDKVSGCFFVDDALGVDRQYDRFMPVVSHVGFDRDGVDGEEEVGIEVAAADVSGVDYVTVSMVPDTEFGSMFTVPFLLGYDPASCMFAGKGSFSLGLEGGRWRTNMVAAGDGIGNGGTVFVGARTWNPPFSEFLFGNSIATRVATLELRNRTPDKAPAMIEAVSANYADGAVELEVTAADEGAGVGSVRVILTTDMSGAPVDLSYDEASGTWKKHFVFESWRPSGTWTISQIQVIDKAFNDRWFSGFAGPTFTYPNENWEDVDTGIAVPSFELVSPGEDRSRPTLVSVALQDPAPITGEGSVQVRLTAEDGGTGVFDVGGNWISGTDCNAWENVSYKNMRFAKQPSGDWLGTMPVWAADRAGTWTLCNLQLQDEAGNFTGYHVDGGVYVDNDAVVTELAPVTYEYAPAAGPVWTRVEAVRLSPTETVAGDVVTLELDVREGTGGPSKIEAIFHRESDDTTRYVPLAPEFNRAGTSGELTTWKAQLNVLPWYDEGDWSLWEFTVFHGDGYMVQYRGDLAEGVYVRSDNTEQVELTTMPLQTLTKRAAE